MNGKKQIKDAQGILKKAVDVLEEEIAAGILAAKKLENNIFNLEDVRNANANDLMSRIRRDAHDSIDIIIDAITVLTHHMGTLTDIVAKGNGNGNHTSDAPKKDPAKAPVVRNEAPIKKGTVTELSLDFSQEQNEEALTISLCKSDLIGPNGSKILARNITLSPPSFSLAPGKQKKVKIKIKIPKTCKAGTYSGLIQDEKNADLRAVISLGI